MKPAITKNLISLVLILTVICCRTSTEAQGVVSRHEQAPLRGVYEVSLYMDQAPLQPYKAGLVKVTFTKPDGREVKVDAFYDGGSLFRARAYCNVKGDWTWRCSSQDENLNCEHGSFKVAGSDLPGKLRKNQADRHQFSFDNGDWFLHIGETGYRCLTTTEKKWKPYIDQAIKMGATKIRTWFCQDRHDVQVLFSEGRNSLNLEYWQEMDRRLTYALEQYPRLQFQLIPYGEDTDELKRYAKGDEMAKLIAQYAQARFSAYPNVQWCISNDREIITQGEENGRKIHASTIHQIARDMAGREPWGTMITNHQSRFRGYQFTDAEWSDITTLEDLDQVSGELILQYRDSSATPVVLDEDRYETYRQPEYPRYFFRRLMWASLLSGGHATYGGYRTYEAHPPGEIGQDSVDVRGIQGYFDGSARLTGGNDFVHIHRFFQDARINLAGMTPDDGYAGRDPLHFKCIRDEHVCVIYLANPNQSSPQKAKVSNTIPIVELSTPGAIVKWFNPSTGEWSEERQILKGKQGLKAPSPGDWIILLRFTSPAN